MKRAFTLVEILAVIGIAVTLGAMTYPVFTQVRLSAQKSTCISNLRQIGLAIALYRNQNDGSDSGTPTQMGLPPGSLLTSLTGALQCHGIAENGKPPGYHITWPDPDSDTATEQFWAKFVARFGASSVLVFDPNHQPSVAPRSRQWENWSVLGLKLDTSVAIRNHRGYPYTLWWWQ